MIFREPPPPEHRNEPLSEPARTLCREKGFSFVEAMKLIGFREFVRLGYVSEDGHDLPVNEDA